MAFSPATRKALPVHAALTGQTTSGKTLSALLLARGLVGPKGKIVGICTERGRMSMFADHPDVGGFYVDEIHPPFTPLRCKEMIDEAVDFGADVIVFDSGSHEWNGLGGTSDMAAAADPNGTKGFSAWNLPKRVHRRFTNTMLSVPCHFIVTLRGSYPLIDGLDRNGKAVKVTSPVMVPEQEKNFLFDMTFHALLENGTHNADFVKLPHEMRGKLPEGPISVATGQIIRSWLDTGEAVDVALRAEQARLRGAAEEGTFALRTAWGQTSKAHKTALKPMLDTELKGIAEAADSTIAALAAAEAEETGDDGLPVKRIDSDDGPAPGAVGKAAPADDDNDPSLDF